MLEKKLLVLGAFLQKSIDDVSESESKEIDTMKHILESQKKVI